MKAEISFKEGNKLGQYELRADGVLLGYYDTEEHAFKTFTTYLKAKQDAKDMCNKRGSLNV